MDHLELHRRADWRSPTAQLVTVRLAWATRGRAGYVDVDTVEEAARICARLSELREGFGVDYAVGYDDQGARVTKPSW